MALDGLAAYRLARVLVADTIAEPLRQWLFLRWPPPGWLLDPGEWPVHPHPAVRAVLGPRDTPWAIGQWDRANRRLDPVMAHDERPTQFYAEKGTKLGEGLRCFYCVSVWASAAVSVVRDPSLLRHPLRLVSRTAATAAVAVCLIEAIDKRGVHAH